ncbi:hypothetical protein KKF55_02755 [Patescibacteria group bacterium]|nr:hypothetical protein [Patescibacteria group bacterium]
MSAVQRIEHNGEIYALIFKQDVDTENGVKFVTEDCDSLQVGFFERDAEYEVKPHRHKSRNLDLKNIGELIILENGKLLVTIFNDEWEKVAEQTVEEGQCLIFLKGGHSIKMLEPSRIMEVKQGPYQENDKIFLES